MALKVSNTPSYTGTLKVVNNYPTTALKVTQNYGYQRPNYNPQPAVNPQPQAGARYVQSTYRPQTTANQQQINQAKVQQEWARQQAEALRIEQERLAYEKLVRKNTFNSTVNVKTNDWKAKVSGAVGLGGVLNQWRGRDSAIKMGNDLNLSAQEIEQAIKHFERELNRRANDFDKNPTQENYNALLAWYNQQEKFFGDTIQNFNTSLEQVNRQASKPFTGKAVNLGRTVTSLANKIGTPAKVAWNAGLWAVSQPSRLVNTAKNFVNPNNLRMYDDGNELKGGKRDLRWAYNASKDQRIFGRGKADEKAQMERLQKTLDRQRANGGTNILGTSTTSGFLRNGEFDRLRILYGDDLANVLADPANWIGAGTVVKGKNAIKTTKFGGKITSKFDDILKGAKNKLAPTLGKDILPSKFGKSDPKKLFPTIGGIYRSPREKMFDLAQVFKASKAGLVEKSDKAVRNAKFIGDNLSDFFDNLNSYKLGKTITDTTDKKITDIAGSPYDRAYQSTELRHDFIGKLTQKSGVHKQLFINAIKNGYKIPTIDRLRYIGRQNKVLLSQVKSDVDEYRKMAKEWQIADGIKANRFTRKDRGYLPYVTDAPYNPAIKRKRRGELDINDLEIALKNRELQSALPMQSGIKRSRIVEMRKQLYKTLSTGRGIKKQAIQAMSWELGVPLKYRGASKTGKQLFNDFFAKVGNLKGQQRGLYRDANLNMSDKVLGRRWVDGKPVDTGKWITRNGHTFYREPGTYLQKSNSTALYENKQRYLAKLNKQHTKKKAIGFPQGIWKALVTVGTPGWYVNNAITNELAGIAGGGLGFLGQQLKHINPLLRTQRKVEKASLPKGVYSEIADGLNLGKAGRFGSAVENSARIPLFKAMKKQGLSDADALKVVNNHLFDYKTHNWDRPVKAVLPFWLWSKNLTKMGATLPFHNPRGANMFRYANDKMNRDYANAPSDQTAYTEDSTGETVEFDRKQKLKGKMRIPGTNKYIDTSWLPFTADRASQYGVNPYISATGEFLSGENKFGDQTSRLNVFTDRTSQTRYLKARFYDQPGIRRWFSKEGYGKEMQGADPTASNYNKYLDPTPNKNRARNAWLGIPNITTYDPSQNVFRNNIAKFNKEYFAIDWDTLRKEDYEGAIAKRDELAKKYGMSWDQVLADWGKYDTSTAKNTKALKESAYSDLNKFWKEWYPLKDRTDINYTNARNQVVRDYFGKIHNGQNPYRQYPVLKGNDKIKGTADDKVLTTATVKDNTAVKVGGKWFKSKASADKYFAYRNKKKNVVQSGGKFFKSAESYQRYVAGQAKKDFWTKYYATDKAGRRKLLDDNPQYNQFGTPKNQEEWDRIKALAKLGKKERMRTISGFAQKEVNMKTFTVPPIKFARTKKIAFKF